MNRRRLRRAAAVLPAAVLLVFCAGALWTLFSPGDPVFLDHPVHRARLGLIVREFLPRFGGLSGWSLGAFAGFDPGTYYGRLGYALALLLQFPFGLAAAYKLALLLSYAWTAGMAYRLFARWFDRDLALAGALGFAVSGPVLGALLGGLWSYVAAWGFAFLFLERLLATRENGVRAVAIAALLWASCFATHVFAAALMTPWLLLLALRRRKFFTLSLLGPAWGALMCAGVWLPLAQTAGWLQGQPPRGAFTAQQCGRAVMGLLMPWPSPAACLLLWAAAAAGAWMYARTWRARLRPEGDRAFFDVLPLAALAFGAVSTGAWRFLNVAALNGLMLDGVRTSLPVHWALLASALLPAQAAVSRLGRGSRVWRRCAGLLVCAAVALFAVRQAAGLRPMMPVESRVPALAPVRGVWAWVRAHADPAATRVLYQDTYGNSADPLLASSHWLALSYENTGVQSLGVWSGSNFFPADRLVNTASGRWMGRTVGTATNRDMIDFCRAYNVRFVVSCSAPLYYKLCASGLFDPVFEPGDGWTVFALRADPAQAPWTDGPGPQPRLLSMAPPEIAFEFDAPGPARVLRLKFGWHPGWRALWNGAPVPLGPDPMALMRVEAPEGRGKLVLYYRPPWKTGAAVSLAFVLAAVGAVFGRRRPMLKGGTA